MVRTTKYSIISNKHPDTNKPISRLSSMNITFFNTRSKENGFGLELFMIISGYSIKRYDIKWDLLYYSYTIKQMSTLTWKEMSVIHAPKFACTLL